MTLVENQLDVRGVFTITLADEAKRNALSQALTAELSAAIDRVDTDTAIRVAVLTNVGSVFCAGADLSERSNPDGEADALDPLTLLRRIVDSPKPWVGRIAGHAVAGGTGLAAACDISVALKDAKFGFTEVRLGLAPALMAAICLPKMPVAQARAVFIRGNRFDGTKAARLGLVTEAVTPDALDQTVAAIVDDLLLGGPEALAATKDVLSRIPNMNSDEAFVWAAARSAELFASDEAAEGMASYLEKRPPSWADADNN